MSAGQGIPGMPGIAAVAGAAGAAGAGAAVGTAGGGGELAVAGARKVGLWVFMAVVTSLFMLFSIAYVMRMTTADWQPLRYVPWQLWLSTAVLALASAAWEAARRSLQSGAAEAAADMAAGSASMPAAPAGAAARIGLARSGRRAALLACALSLAFLAVQLWAWQAMTAMNFTVSGNPASSFFYLLTGLHGLHVCGGLVAAALAGASAGRGRAAFAASAALCARYWHFLLLLWLALFALMFLVTPDFVQVVCESVGIVPPQAR